jgi:hypothetical protein
VTQVEMGPQHTDLPDHSSGKPYGLHCFLSRSEGLRGPNAAHVVPSLALAGPSANQPQRAHNGSSLSTPGGLGWADEDVCWPFGRPRGQLSPRMLTLR